MNIHLGVTYTVISVRLFHLSVINSWHISTIDSKFVYPAYSGCIGWRKRTPPRESSRITVDVAGAEIDDLLQTKKKKRGGNCIYSQDICRILWFLAWIIFWLNSILGWDAISLIEIVSCKRFREMKWRSHVRGNIVKQSSRQTRFERFKQKNE